MQNRGERFALHRLLGASVLSHSAGPSHRPAPQPPYFFPEWWAEYTRVPPVNRFDPFRRKVSAPSHEAQKMETGADPAPGLPCPGPTLPAQVGVLS
jgi:hypothetical protein